MSKGLPLSDGLVFPTSTELEAVDTALEPSGPVKPGHEVKGESMWGPGPAAGAKVTAFSLALELGASVARIRQALEQWLPDHPNLAAFSPTSRIGPRLAEVICRAVTRGAEVRSPPWPPGYQLDRVASGRD